MGPSCSSLRPRRSGCSAPWLGALSAAVALAACGGGGGDATSAGIAPMTAATVPSTPSDAMMAKARSPTALPRSYSARVLDETGQAGPQSLNASGQVAFTVTGSGGSRARFFDGHTVRVVANDQPARAVAVNDAGIVAGFLLLDFGSNSRVFAWDPSTPNALAMPDTEPGRNTVAEDIGSQGLIVGTLTARGVSNGFLWRPGSVFLTATLPPFGPLPAFQSFGRFINAGGAAAGVSTAATGGVHAAYWPPGAPAIDVGTFGGANSSPVGLNDAGQVAGQADTANGTHHAFLWSQGAGLGGLSSAATALNANGSVVGSADTADGASRAFLWQGGSMQSLGTLGGADSAATSINAAGQVGGTARVADGSMHAFVWSAEDGMVDLNDRSVPAKRGVLRSVIAVGDNGTVLVASDAGLVWLRPHGPPVR